MTDRGLSTPAVQRIVSSRRTPPPSRWPIGKARKAPDAQAQAPVLLRRLAEARRVEAVVVVSRVCDEITAVTGGEPETQAQLVAAVEDAHRWLEQQAEVRRELFSRLEEELAGPRTKTKVRELLVRVNAHASHDRTTAEHEIADAAAAYLAALASAAAERARALLADLRRAPWDAPRTLLLPMVEELVEVAAGAGSLLHGWETRQMAFWMASAGFEKPAAVPSPRLAEARAAAAQREKNKEEAAAEEAPLKPRLLHKQVARRFWIKRDCPLCHAGQGVECRDDDQSGTGKVRRIPHDERLQPIVDERKAKQQQRPRPWRVYDLACPDCGREPGERCATPGGPHYARVERAKEYTRMRLHPPEREALDGPADQSN
ncbi:hypothetical protein [Streptomyces katrae]|uniref:hypothetical protein n=1 Tax=Streptomyces katrae TaxID=68223 RepID=UPI001F19B9ED|nr:hypothetical protein [Streptomyces katrae]